MRMAGVWSGVAAVLGGCAGGGDTTETARDAVVAAPALAPYTQRIDGTDLTMDFRPVPAMTVTIDGAVIDVPAFYAATTEVTWDVYDLFVYGDDDAIGADGAIVTRPSKPYVAPDLGYGHQGYAAISVAFRGAESFCAWLSARTGATYRLPTEAEWRAMCAAGGVTDATRDAHAWHDGNADYTPHPVGTRCSGCARAVRRLGQRARVGDDDGRRTDCARRVVLRLPRRSRLRGAARTRSRLADDRSPGAEEHVVALRRAVHGTARRARAGVARDGELRRDTVVARQPVSSGESPRCPIILIRPPLTP